MATSVAMISMLPPTPARSSHEAIEVQVKSMAYLASIQMSQSANEHRTLNPRGGTPLSLRRARAGSSPSDSGRVIRTVWFGLSCLGFALRPSLIDHGAQTFELIR